MGKGDENVQAIVDVNGAGVTYRVQLHLWDELEPSEVDDLVSAAGNTQNAFDSEMGNIFGWYDRQSSTVKARFREAFQNLPG